MEHQKRTHRANPKEARLDEVAERLEGGTAKPRRTRKPRRRQDDDNEDNDNDGDGADEGSGPAVGEKRERVKTTPRMADLTAKQQRLTIAANGCYRIMLLMEDAFPSKLKQHEFAVESFDIALGLMPEGEGECIPGLQS